MASSRPPRKIHDFFIGGGSNGIVKSCYIGRRTAEVVVTGSSEGIVNAWKPGRVKPLANFRGHTGEVDTVALDCSEETVFSGCSDGGVRVWDLRNPAPLRCMSSQGRGISSIDAHPFGDYFASGSNDGKINVWDCRWRNSIATYSGHRRQITVLKHSPDGQWIVSADVDGAVKLWSLTAGKILRDLPGNRRRVNAIDFHPGDLLLAIVSEALGVELWDLDCWQELCTVPPCSPAVRCVAFNHQVETIVMASETSVSTWGWEPLHCFDSVEAPFTALGDCLVLPNETFISVCHFGSTVSVFELDLHTLAPLNRDPAAAEKDEVDKRSESSPMTAQRPVSTVPPIEESTGPANIAPTLYETLPTNLVRDQASTGPSQLDASVAPSCGENGKAGSVAPHNSSDRIHVETAKSISPTLPETSLAPTPPEDAVALTPSPGMTPQGTSEEVFVNLMKDHDNLMRTLGARLNHIRILSSIWSSRPCSAVDALSKIPDLSVLADFALAVQHVVLEDHVELELLPKLINTLYRLLSSGTPRYVSIGLRSLHVTLLRHRLVLQSRHQDGVDKDVSRFASSCIDLLNSNSFGDELRKLSQMDGETGDQSRSLTLLIDQLR